MLDTRYQAPRAEGADHLRVLARDHRIEVYLNREWMFGMTIPDSLTGSGLGPIVTDDATCFGTVRVAEIEPLVPTDP